MAVETLADMPSTGPLLLRAVLTARGRRGDVVPERTLRVEDLRVDRRRLGSYQRVTGFPVSDVLPAPYPWVLAFPVQTALMARPDFPLALPGLVHLSNRVRTHRAVHADEALTLDVTAGDLRAHRRGRTLDVRLEATVGDDLVWECDSVYLSRGRGSEDAPRGDTPPELPDGPPSAVWRLAEDLGREYAAVSGDVNPIHLHPLTARVMGFPRHIAHGMWTYARTLAALGRSVPEASTSRVWFTKPVPLPSTVELVRGESDGALVAGLRSPRDHAAHVVVTVAV